MADVLDSPSSLPLPPPPLPPPPPGPPPRKRDRSRSRSRSADPQLPPPPPIVGSSRPQRYRSRSPGSRSPPSRSRSPPRHRRRSPPPKRSRGGYDDRRYGYDDRAGGRGGYGDDRHHGRYPNRVPDWFNSGPGAFGDGQPRVQREGLMTYKQFIQLLEDDVLPSEAERRYKEYKTEYITTQKRAYFDLHKNEDWLKDKYHPTNLVSTIERRNEHCKAMAKEFFLDLQSGTLDLGPGLSSAPTQKAGNASDGNSEDESDMNEKRRRYGKGPKEADPLSSAPKAHPVSSEPHRIQADIDNTLSLIRKLDSEKGIDGNILVSCDNDKSDESKSHVGPMGPIIIIRGLNTVKGLEGVELLDTLLTYLWRIHGVDYYGMSETNDAKGLRHVRASPKSSGESNISADDWEKKLDSFWMERVRSGQDPLVVLTAKEKIDAAAAEVLDPYVRKIRDEKYGWKYGCGAKGCTKLFHAPEFVHKHLKNKHSEIVIELTAKLREDIYFDNYMNDPDAPGGTPIMQQSAPVDKVRRRPLLEGRLRDDRANRRDYDRPDKDDDKFKRRDIPRDVDHGSDEQMFSSVSADPFITEFPAPPVLMPVPGAGPLGPFVPAPPEIAMHMLRDQGPPSFEAGVADPRGKKGMLGPLIAPPIIGMPPAFQRDPRRIRRYHDLDAPEEEVTVIDYRSL